MKILIARILEEPKANELLGWEFLELDRLSNGLLSAMISKQVSSVVKDAELDSSLYWIHPLHSEVSTILVHVGSGVISWKSIGSIVGEKAQGVFYTGDFSAADRKRCEKMFPSLQKWQSEDSVWLSVEARESP